MGSSYARDGELRERGMRGRGYPQIRGVGFRRARVPRYRVGMARRRAVGVIGVIAGLALLAACSGQPETPAPTSLPTQTVTPEPSTPPGGTPEPTPFPTDQLPERLSDLVTEPVLPDEASEFTTDGAAAFAHYIIDATNWAIASGDPGRLLESCSDEAKYCQNVDADVTAERDGVVVRHGGFTHLEATQVDLYQDDHRAFVTGTVHREPYVDIDEFGAASTQVGGSEFEVVFQLVFDDNWILEGAGTP